MITLSFFRYHISSVGPISSLVIAEPVGTNLLLLLTINLR